MNGLFFLYGLGFLLVLIAFWWGHGFRIGIRAAIGFMLGVCLFAAAYEGVQTVFRAVFGDPSEGSWFAHGEELPRYPSRWQELADILYSTVEVAVAMLLLLVASAMTPLRRVFGFFFDDL